MQEKRMPIACQLNALSQAERAREGELLKEHLAARQETRALENGYAFRYGADPALFTRMAELVSLEHRCCPFLEFRLEWPRADASPWLYVTGDAEAKELVGDTFADGG